MNDEQMKPTIVGAQPWKENEHKPGAGKVQAFGPTGMEIMLKKAKADPEYKKELLKNRGNAAFSMKLVLEEIEIAILNSVPEEMLSEMIDTMNVARTK